PVSLRTTRSCRCGCPSQVNRACGIATRPTGSKGGLTRTGCGAIETGRTARRPSATRAGNPIRGANAMTRKILLCVGVCVAGVGSVAGGVRVAQTGPQPAAPVAALDEVRIDVVNVWLPIAEAVKKIERRFGRVVTYEDVPHVAPSDLVDFTDQVTHGQPWPRRIYRPRP